MEATVGVGLKWVVSLEIEALLERERARKTEAKQRRESRGKRGSFLCCWSVVAMRLWGGRLGVEIGAR